MDTTAPTAAASPTTLTTPTTPTRVVVVTGAGTGIGQATARAFARQGATVVAVGRRTEPLRETAEGHPGIQPFVADVTAEGAAEEIVRAAVTGHGRLDVLVNNAGISMRRPLGTLDRSVIAPLLETNLVAPVLLTQAAVPALRESRGVVVNVTTTIGQRGWAGQLRLSGDQERPGDPDPLLGCGARARRRTGGGGRPRRDRDPDRGPHGPLPEQLKALRAWQLAHTPLGRIGRPEEVAWAITSLAAPDASFLTGTVLPVDGGALVA